jgi:Flp pilus assembly protein TadG
MKTYPHSPHGAFQRRDATAAVHSPRGRFQRGDAIAAVELAVVLPLAALLIVGLPEVSRIVAVTQIVCNAAREGARKASTGVNTYADVQTTMANYLSNAGIPNQTGLTVAIYQRIVVVPFQRVS